MLAAALTSLSYLPQLQKAMPRNSTSDPANVRRCGISWQRKSPAASRGLFRKLSTSASPAARCNLSAFS
ncbi:MAG: hypothetical protein E8A46_02505 [Bradyrhizobium sp.]|nr:MAG: hypothetical protein E8A46_02505 [Bradyrhizobium sp.]